MTAVLAPARTSPPAPVLLPAATSTAIAGLLTGRRRPARVVASTRHAVMVAVEPSPDADGEESADELSLLCLAGPQAVRLPCALLLPNDPPQAPVGASATVGRGELRIGALTVAVGRWWRAPQPRLDDAASAIGRAETLALPPLDASLARPAIRLAEALHAGDDLSEPVRSLLGLGCGLTPAGDDVIAGALVALRAANSPAADRLAATVASAEPTMRTTAISTGLLHHAARGECVPELAALIAALDGRGHLRQSMLRLLNVGHTSGTALCHGAVLAIAGLRPSSLKGCQ